MSDARRSTPEAIERAIVEALAVVVPDAGQIDQNTHLLGGSAVVDSVGFVNLLVTLEQMLPGPIDLASSYLEQADGDERDNPFFSVGSLVRHVEHLSQQAS